MDKTKGPSHAMSEMSNCLTQRSSKGMDRTKGPSHAMSEMSNCLTQRSSKGMDRTKGRPSRAMSEMSNCLTQRSSKGMDRTKGPSRAMSEMSNCLTQRSSKGTDRTKGPSHVSQKCQIVLHRGPARALTGPRVPHMPVRDVKLFDTEVQQGHGQDKGSLTCQSEMSNCLTQRSSKGMDRTKGLSHASQRCQIV